MRKILIIIIILVFSLPAFAEKRSSDDIFMKAINNYDPVKHALDVSNKIYEENKKHSTKEEEPSLPVDPSVKGFAGFRGIAWGTNIKDLKDFKYDRTEGGFKVYTKNDEYLYIGRASLFKVNYYFKDNKFVMAMATFSPGDWTNKIEPRLVETYGEGERYEPMKKLTEHYINNKNATVVYANLYNTITPKEPKLSSTVYFVDPELYKTLLIHEKDFKMYNEIIWKTQVNKERKDL